MTITPATIHKISLNWPLLVAGGALYFLCARFGMLLFSLQPSNITLLWLASGVGLVLVLRFGLISLPVVMLASFSANYQGMTSAEVSDPLLHLLVAALADTFSAWLAARLLRWRLPDGLQRVADLVPFSLYVCFIPTLLCALILVLNLSIGGYILHQEAAVLIRHLVLADSLGIVLIYPLYQSWPQQCPPQRQWGWLLAIMGLCVLVLGLSYNGLSGCIYFILPLLLVLIFRIASGGVYLVLLLVVAAILALSARDLGPFRALSQHEAHFMLLGFVFSTAFVCLSLTLYYRQLQEADASIRLWQSEALHDALTGLLNRRGFTPLLTSEFQRVARSLRPSVFVLLDLDHFKTVNDKFGHLEGDLVLQVVARLLTTNLREIDQSARIGGEEFAILLPEATAEQAVEVLNRIRQQLSDYPLQLAGVPVSVTFSAGVVEFSGEDCSVEALFSAADKSLYVAKTSGRNRIEVAAKGVLNASSQSPA